MAFCLIHGNISLLSCQETHIPRLITPAEKGRDLEPRVIDTYIVQSQAEAQEGKTCLSLQYRSLVCVCVCDGSCVCVFSDHCQSHRAEAQRLPHRSAGIRDRKLLPKGR